MPQSASYIISHVYLSAATLGFMDLSAFIGDPCTTFIVFQDAVRGDHGDLATLLIQRGGRVLDKDSNLVELADSPLAGNVRIFTDYDPEWEIDPSTIKFSEKIGERAYSRVGNMGQDVRYGWR